MNVLLQVLLLLLHFLLHVLTHVLTHVMHVVHLLLLLLLLLPPSFARFSCALQLGIHFFFSLLLYFGSEGDTLVAVVRIAE